MSNNEKMKSFQEIDFGVTFTFLCDCGSYEFERPREMQHLKGFYAGHFLCSNCGAEHPYHSESFHRNQTQMSLF